MLKKNKKHFLSIDPAKSPIFYGYIVLVIGSIGVFCSIPGQTIGVSVFTDPVKDALGLSRNQFSNAYLIGTIASALIIGRAGVWFDKYGARLVAFFAALTLGIALFLSSWSLHMSNFVKSILEVDSWMIPFVIITFLFFLLRFAGQGVLTMASRNMIMIWFDKNRGKVNAFTSIAISFGFSASPLWVDALIESNGWQGAWKWLGAALLLFSILIFLLYKNKPEDYGLIPDGKIIQNRNPKASNTVSKQFTLKEAKSQRAFWMYALILAFNSFFVTGLTFHIVSIFESQGFPKSDAIAIFLPASVVAVIVSIIFNYLSDYLPLKLFLYLMILGGIVASVGFLSLPTIYGIPLLITGFGILSGFYGVLNTIAWPRFFGREHLGAISGRVMSFLILASALAPSIFSLCYTSFGSYHFLGYLGLSYLLFIAIGSIKANNPNRG
ncbi:MFS transporter [Portibacter lacus]|uniref:MFS transporter n=1 Tax=Portibacter lacus TaxID=1099794 RepID=A0AA37WHF9_9BACT|nr:MFS transporter [Portibacter lacus]GLR19274.1 MFS transporter [Portibacter lacus]